MQEHPGLFSRPTTHAILRERERVGNISDYHDRILARRFGSEAFDKYFDLLGSPDAALPDMCKAITMLARIIRIPTIGRNRRRTMAKKVGGLLSRWQAPESLSESIAMLKLEIMAVRFEVSPNHQTTWDYLEALRSQPTDSLHERPCFLSVLRSFAETEEESKLEHVANQIISFLGHHSIEGNLGVIGKIVYLLASLKQPFAEIYRTIIRNVHEEGLLDPFLCKQIMGPEGKTITEHGTRRLFEFERNGERITLIPLLEELASSPPIKGDESELIARLQL